MERGFGRRMIFPRTRRVVTENVCLLLAGTSALCALVIAYAVRDSRQIWLHVYYVVAKQALCFSANVAARRVVFNCIAELLRN